jgi:hypothetical protein
MAVCSYPESGKRGFPAVYMSSLEKRLQETEHALYRALTALKDKGGMNSLVVPHIEESANLAWLQLSKVEKQEEWTRLPLNSREQLAFWFHDKQKAGHHAETPDEHLLTSEMTSPAEREQENCGPNSYAGMTTPRQPEQTLSAVLEQQRMNSETTSEQCRECEILPVITNAHHEISDPWRNYF